MSLILPVYNSSALSEIYNFYYDIGSPGDKPVYKEVNKIMNLILKSNYLGNQSYTYTYNSNPNVNDYFVKLLQKIYYVFPDSFIFYRTYDSIDSTNYLEYKKTDSISYTPSVGTSVTNSIIIDWTSPNYYNGQITFSYTYAGVETLDIDSIKSNLPFIFYSGVFELSKQPFITVNNSISNSIITVVVYVYTYSSANLSDADFGLTFKNVRSFYGDTVVTITQMQNIPLSKSGFQFAYLSNLSLPSGVGTVIYPNTSLQGCFNASFNFNSDISGWDTSNVVNMSEMFYAAVSFNQPLNSWNTSNVTDMSFMFSGATSFNQPLNLWNTSNVQNMPYMFYEAVSFNQPLNSWNTSITNVTDMSYMFYNAISFNSANANWTINPSTNIENMFYPVYAPSAPTLNTITRSSNNDLNVFFTLGSNGGSQITDVEYSIDNGPWISSGNIISPIVISGLLTSISYSVVIRANNSVGNSENSNVLQSPIILPTKNGTYSFNYTLPSPVPTIATVKNKLPFIWLTGTFELVEEPNIDINLTSSVVTVTLNTKLFTNSPNLNTIDFDFGLTFKNVNTFYGSRNVNITQIEEIPLSKTGYQFASLSNLSIVQGQNPIILPNTSLSNCFFSSSRFNSNINDWNTSNVTDMSYMFWKANIFNNPIGTWNTSNVTNMSYMFNNATTFNQHINYDIINNYWNTSNVTDMSFMFTNSKNFNNPIGSWNTSNVTNMSNMFYTAFLFNQPIGSWNTNKVIKISNMFYQARDFNNGNIKMLWTFNTRPESNNWHIYSSLTLANAPDTPLLPF